ncbi:hypothetical protein [Leucobacter aridicollis]|uniref:hypothetical protein n=1 Tax=Leucobacter aridicollis TaxID=283878 RepID=UPI0021696480|nr:hypothetical protein [Leucobacter aridicollis]
MAAKRFQPYAAVFKGDQEQAARLYALNVELSGALLELLHFAEIGLRERMHTQLSREYGRYWFFRNGPLLDDRSRSKVATATKYFGKHPDPGRVVAEFSFGFWRELLTPGGKVTDSNNKYLRHADYQHELWEPALHRVFLERGRTSYDMKDAEHLTRRVQRARNRVSHHESLVFGVAQPGEQTSDKLKVRQSPHAMLADIRELLAIVSPEEVNTWLASCRHAEELITDDLAHAALDHALLTLNDVSWI